MERQYKAEMIRVLDKMLSEHSFDNRAVFLFGHCNAAEEMADYLLSRKVVPNAILDNSTAKQGLSYKNIPITPPELIKNYTTENSVILIAARFYAEMFAQLRRLGYNGEIIQVVEYNSFAEYSLSDKTLRRKTERMRRGLIILGQIRERYLSEHLIICPNNALGDVYWAMSFLGAYREKHKINKVAVVVIGNSCCQVAEMFGIDKIITLNNTEMDEFAQAVIFTHENNCIIAHHDRPYTDNIIKRLDKHFLSFIDYYRYAVYGLSKDTLPVPPCKLAPFENKEQILKDKSVILSPYAKSVVELPTEFWEKIAANYAVKSLAVYTNVVSGEHPIKSTLPLNIPISQMLSAVEYAGNFYGIRSGLCDVLHTANCCKTVVFPDCYYSTTPHKVADFFYLPDWENIVFKKKL